MVRPGPEVKKEVTSESREMGKHWALLCSVPGPVADKKEKYTRFTVKPMH